MELWSSQAQNATLSETILLRTCSHDALELPAPECLTLLKDSFQNLTISNVTIPKFHVTLNVRAVCNYGWWCWNSAEPTRELRKEIEGHYLLSDIYIAYRLLSTAYYLISISYYLLYLIYYPLSVIYNPLYVVYCLLSIIYYVIILPIFHYLLYTIYWILPIAYRL